MLNIANIRGFDWDAGNVNKNYHKHFVHLRESEEIFLNEPLIISKDTKHTSKELRYQCLGHTDNGRLLFISFTIRNNKIRVISARPQSKKERKQYEKY